MTGPAPQPRGTRARAGGSLGILLAALALAACSAGGTTTEPTEQEPPVQSVSPEPTPGPTSSGTTASGTPAPGSGAASSTPPSAAPGSTPPSAGAGTPPEASGTGALLTVTVQQDPEAEPAQYVLECVDGAPGPTTTLPGAENACAALTRLGTGFFTALPNKDVICTQQYGGPQTASITGTLDGTSVVAAFSLTDGCQISRWTAAQDILGAPGAL